MIVVKGSKNELQHNEESYAGIIQKLLYEYITVLFSQVCNVVRGFDSQHNVNMNWTEESNVEVRQCRSIYLKRTYSI